MRDPHEINAELQVALAAYREIANTASAPELHAKHQVVKALQAELAASIAEGANPCPDCGAQPHGMFQAKEGGGVQFEVGCISASCRWFRLAGENVARRYAGQGNMPRHAVECWNAGPRYWVSKAVGPRFSAEEFGALPVRE